MSPVRPALALSLIIVAACDAPPAPTTVDGGPDATGVAPCPAGTTAVQVQLHSGGPAVGAEVLTHAASGDLLERHQVDATGQACVGPAAAWVTATIASPARFTATEPVDARTLILLHVRGVETPVRRPVVVTNPPAGTVATTISTDCGFAGPASGQLDLYPCVRPLTTALAVATDANSRTLGVAVAPIGATITFDTWEPVVPMPVEITDTVGLASVFTHVMIDRYNLVPADQVAPSRGVMFDVREDLIEPRFRGQRRLATAPPSRLDISANEFLPFLTDAQLSLATGRPVIELSTPPGGFDDCRLLVPDETFASRWISFTGPIDGVATVTLPALPADIQFAVRQWQLDCYRNVVRTTNPYERLLPPDDTAPLSFTGALLSP